MGSVLLAVGIFFIISPSAALTPPPGQRVFNCSQCNMPLRNVPNLCNDPREMTDCIGCMKTVTKVKIRDSGYINGWERLSVVTSRYCMRYGSTNVQPAGCYKQLNNGGYTERCYCYSNNCNSKGHRLGSPLALILTLTPIILTLVGHLARST